MYFTNLKLIHVLECVFCIVPTAPVDLKVMESSFTTVSLTWALPNPPNGFITSYTVSIKLL